MIEDGYESAGSLQSARLDPPELGRTRQQTRVQNDQTVAADMPQPPIIAPQNENLRDQIDTFENTESADSTESQSVLSAPSANHSEHRYSINDIQDVILALGLNRIPTPQNQQQIPPAIKVAAVVTPPAITNRVPHAEYVITTTAQSKQLESIRLSNSGSTNKEMLKALKLNIIECKLYPLATGDRPPPVCTPNNTFGYTEDIMTTGADGTSRMTPKDDFAKFQHDNDRLCSILHLAIKPDLHYLVESCMEKRDASSWYLKIVEHIHGTTNTDIRKARKTIEDLRIGSGKTVKENISLIEEAIKTYNTASNSTMPDPDKLYWLQEKFNDDKRMPVQGFMATAKSEGLNYQDTVRRLILVDPAIVPVHKMASLTTVPAIALCQRHQRGVCPDGPNCKYSHGPKVPGTKTSAPPGKGPPPDTKTAALRRSDDKFPRTPFKKPLVVSNDHRHTVGLPRGKPSTKNPDGFSHKQLSFIHQLQSVDAWSSGDTSYFNASSDPGSQHRFNMFQVQDAEPQSSSTSSSTIVTVELKSALLESRNSFLTTQEYESSRRDFISYEEDDIDEEIDDNEDLLSTRLHLSCPPNQTQIQNHDADIIKMVTEHNASYVNYDTADPTTGIILFIHNTSNKFHVSFPVDNHHENVCFAAFGWMGSYSTLHRHTDGRTDVLSGDPALLALLYKINKIFFQARVELPLPSATSRAYMTFDPALQIYHEPNEVGHYSSTVTCMSSYIVALRELSRHIFPIAVENMLRLGLYYDFMSFVNKAYTMCAHSRSPVPPKRKLLLGELVSFSLQPELMKLYAYDFLVMECIIKSVGPKPSTPGPGMHVPQPDTAHEHWDDDAPDPSQYGESSPVKTPQKARLSTTSAAATTTAAPYRSGVGHPRHKDPTGPSPPRRLSNKRTVQKLYTGGSPNKAPRLTSGSQQSLSSEDAVEFNSFTVSETKMLSFKSSAPKIIIDSGASTCGTGQASQLHNIRESSAIVTPAFGAVAQPTHMGDLPPYMLKTIVIDDMKDTTLLSVSQMCATGQIAVFTPRDCRFYKLESVLPFLKDLSLHGKETIRGKVENGLYIQEST